jgi:hypothetical protein
VGIPVRAVRARVVAPRQGAGAARLPEVQEPVLGQAEKGIQKEYHKERLTFIMSIYHKYTLLCDYAMTSDPPGRLVFAGTFTNIELPKIPGALIRFFVAVGFTGDKGDEWSVSIVDPKGKTLETIAQGKIETVPELQEGQTYINSIIVELGLLEFKDAGTHNVVLKQGKRVIHRFAFGVLRKKGD